MNENLKERFSRGKSTLTARSPVTLNLSIREYAKTTDQLGDQSHWTGFREIPSPSEVFDKGRTEHSTALVLAENTVVGPYESKEAYLESHYGLLREDAVAPLRDAVSEVQYYPQLMEKDSDNGAYIYEKVSYKTVHLWCTLCSHHPGLHHCPDFRQCRNCSPRHLFIKTSWQESQLGTVKTAAYRRLVGTESGKRYVFIYLPHSRRRS